MDAPCHGLIVLAPVEVAVLKDPAAREETLSCVTIKLPPNTHGQPNTGTPANKSVWQASAFGLFTLIPPCRGFGGGLLGYIRNS